MNPLDSLDAFANAMADAVTDALVKTALIASCVGLSVACAAVLLTRKRRG